MIQLAQKQCKACEGGTDPLTREKAQTYLNEVPDWTLSDDAKRICRTYTMKNFVAGVDFIRQIADVAEQENHHPDVHLTDYRKLKVVLSTHKIGGLAENDFILAAKINALQPEVKR